MRCTAGGTLMWIGSPAMSTTTVTVGATLPHPSTDQRKCVNCLTGAYRCQHAELGPAEKQTRYLDFLCAMMCVRGDVVVASQRGCGGVVAGEVRGGTAASGERQQRLVMAGEARSLGHGGIAAA